MYHTYLIKDVNYILGIHLKGFKLIHMREKFVPGPGFEPRSPALSIDAVPLSYPATYRGPAANLSLYLQ